MSIATQYGRQPRSLIFLETVFLLMGVGYFDLITGYETSMFIFYGIPIVIALWFVDQRAAFFLSILGGLVWWWADSAAGHIYTQEWLQLWNVGMRTVFFVLLVIGGNAMKTQNTAFAARLEVVNRLRLLEQEIVTASEREQQRIGQDIHDGLCQHLAAIGMAVAALKDDLPPKQAATATEIEDLLKEGISQARNIARGLAPVPMDEAGLTSALDDLADRINRLSDLECHFEYVGEVIPLRPETASHLYRIAQEAVNNVIKHAAAKRLEITLTGSSNGLELRIQDDGRGLPANQHSNGMGLRTMRYRAGIIGAELQVGTAEDGGSAIFCRVPRYPDHRYQSL